MGSGLSRWVGGGEAEREAGAAARQAAPRLNRWSLCAQGGGREDWLSLPAGPGGEAFELLAWGRRRRRRAWANPASHSPFSNQLENVYSLTGENRTNT